MTHMHRLAAVQMNTEAAEKVGGSSVAAAMGEASP